MLVKSQVKYIQSLGQKKHRDADGVFIAEGPKIVGELMGTGLIQQIYGTKDWMDEYKSKTSGIEVIEITNEELEKISQLTTPNKVLAISKKMIETGPIELKGKIVLALDTIQDPGNLGTIIRTADWFGIDQVLCSPDCADIYNPKVVQSTMGSIARVKVFYTDLAQWLQQTPGIRIYAAMLEGQNVLEMKKPAEGVVVIGNESKGISENVQKLVNVKITIPQKGAAESLNAAVATGIILSAIT
jgi:TrmH family RNA methyltransferase